MKKIGRFLLLSFSFILSFMVLGSNELVEAKTNVLYQNNEEVSGCKKENQEYGDPNATFWEIVCAPYSVVEGKEDTNTTKYTFNKLNHNYNFEYDYEIQFDVTEGYIRDNSAFVTGFIGISEDTTITYSNIEVDDYYHLKERFEVYKYNNATGTFELQTNYDYNSSGSHVIDEYGIYKLDTYVEGGGTAYTTYIVYEKGFYYSSLREITYDSDFETIEYKLAVNTPERLSCSNHTVRINATTLSGTECEVYDSESYGDYEVVIQAVVPIELSSINNRQTDISFNGTNFSTNITYDSADPELIGDVTYYPADMAIDEFAIYYNNSPLTLPNNVVVKFAFNDNNNVSVTVNDRSCSLDENVATCYVTYRDGDYLVYVLEDTYGNYTMIEHEAISYSGDTSIDTEILKEYITISGSIIEFTNLEEYSEFNKICLIYGDDISTFVCANSTSTLLIESSKYYDGPITVVLADENINLYKLEYDVILNNGYSNLNYVYTNIEGNLTNEHEITNEVKELIELACNDEAECLDTVKVYAEFGSAEKLLSEDAEFTTLSLPTYLEMINKGFTHKSCAFEKCDEVINVYVYYKIGGVEQKLYSSYHYLDKLPQMSSQMDAYNETRSYDFSTLDIGEYSIKKELFATPFPIQLIDGYGNEYNAQISSRFIRYTDRNGNVTNLNNEPYTYIANNKNFGYYLLEGYVKVNDEDIYGKSFFIVVELADKKAPTLTLIGDKTMKIKQYDVFKDPEFKCSDASECNTTIKYYYQNEKNEVEKIDTATHGTYIIKYTAIDGDGNVSELTRTVIVESVNAMNATSIIIIVAVVVLLVGSIVIAIIIEKKKSKEEE